MSFTLLWYSLLRHWNDSISDQWKHIHFGMTPLDFERCIAWLWQCIPGSSSTFSAQIWISYFLKEVKHFFVCEIEFTHHRLDNRSTHHNGICHYFLASYVGRTRMCRLYYYEAHHKFILILQIQGDSVFI